MVLIGRVIKAPMTCLIGFLLGAASSAVPALAKNCMGYVFTDVSASSEPDLGGIEPAHLVKAGTKVQLHGTARIGKVNAQCQVQNIENLPFQWQVTFQAKAAPLADVKIDNGASLDPSFDATEAGVYTAAIVAAGRTAAIQIEAIATGRRWFSIGPSGDGFDKFDANVGRLNTLAFDPAGNFVMYAGSALGGVFKSMDDGRTWRAMTDHQSLPTLGIGALAVGADGSVYAGTGDINGPGYAPIFQTGGDVRKSTDGGVTWKLAGGCPNVTLFFTGNATKIVVHPSNANVLYVAAREGLFRSKDGGTCWERILAIGATDAIGVTDVVMDPTDPTTLYVATPNVQPLVRKITKADDPVPSFHALKIPLADKYLGTVLAVAPSAPQTVYAALATAVRTDLIRSGDGGETWTIGQSRNGCGSNGESQCSHDMAIAVHPKDSKRVVYGERYAWQSMDGTQSWANLRNESGHNDYHTILFHPTNPDLLYAANDGGVYSLVLPPADSPNPNPVLGWYPYNEGLAIAQAPGLAVAPMDPAISTIGAWDNGSHSRNNGRFWSVITGADGFNASIDAAPQLAYYANYDAGNGGAVGIYPVNKPVVNQNSGAYFSNPFRAGELFVIGPNGFPGLYVAEQINIAQPKWYCADPRDVKGPQAFTMEFSPDGSYYVSYRDGTIWRFTLDGNNLKSDDCENHGTNAKNASEFFVAGRDADIELSMDPFDSTCLFATLGSGESGDRVVHLCEVDRKLRITELAGKAGDQGALPDILSRSPIQADPSTKDVLYLGIRGAGKDAAGNDPNGLWEGIKQDNGTFRWEQNKDIPDTFVIAIVAHRNNINGYSGVLRLTTYGRGVWERFHEALVHAPPPTCLSCASIANHGDTLRERRAEPESNHRVVRLTVPYNYSGPAGSTALVNVVPLTDGVPQPYFVTEPQTVRPGSGSARVLVLYAAHDAPLGLRTNQLRVDVTPSVPSSLGPLTSILKFDKWWLRPEGRLVTVVGRAIDPGPVAIPAPLKVTIDYQIRASRMPITFPVRAGTRITLMTSPTLTSQQGKWRFLDWTANERLGGAKPMTKMRVAQSTAMVANFTRIGESRRPPKSRRIAGRF